MKLVEGQTLREILDAGSMSHMRLIEIFTHCLLYTSDAADE